MATIVRDARRQERAGVEARAAARSRSRRWTWAALLSLAALLVVLPPEASAMPGVGVAAGSAAAASASAAATPPAEPTAAEKEELSRRAEILARAHAAVVGLRSHAVEGATSIATLGTDRLGSGVVIDADGLVLTIGYLILEAEHVDLLLDRLRTIPARVVAYDVASGFGLVQALAPLGLPPARLGESGKAPADEPLLIASGGAAGGVSLAQLVSRRPFSGYWEYHIDGALFTSPPRPDHSGAALFNADGELLGIGSLLVGDAVGAGTPGLPGNMFVPVDLLKPILPELRVYGSSRLSRRAWIGASSVEKDGAVYVVRVAPDSPAEAAGLLPGDQIVGIDGTEVRGLESFYKALWQGEPPDREVQLSIRRGGTLRKVEVQATDRMRTLRRAVGV